MEDRGSKSFNYGWNMCRVLCVEEDSHFRSMLSQISFDEGIDSMILSGLQFHQIFFEKNSQQLFVAEKDWDILILDHTLIRQEVWTDALQIRPWAVILTSWLTCSDIDKLKNMSQVFAIFHSHKFGSFYEAKSELSFVINRAVSTIPQISALSLYQSNSVAPFAKKRKSQEYEPPIQSSIEVSEQIAKWSQIATTLLYDVVGEDFFQQLVRTLARFLGTKYVMVGQLHGDEVVVTAQASEGNVASPGLRYQLRGTPCDQCINKKALCVFNGDAIQKFPEDPLLQDENLNTYIGIPLFSSDQKPLGIFNAMHDKPLSDVPFAETLIKLLSSRASAEMERTMTMNKLKGHIHIESQMVSLSNVFTKKFNDEKDYCLSLALKTFGGLFSSERAYLYRIYSDKQGGWLQIEQEWTRDGVTKVDNELRRIRPENFPFCLPSEKKPCFVEMHSEGIERMQKLGPAAKKQLEQLREILFVPISQFGEVTAYLGFDFENNPGCIVTSNFDILTLLAEMIGAFEERRSFHEKLVKSKELAEVGDRAKSEFLAMISHELRTPLTGILGNLTLLRDSPLSHDQTEQLDVIRSCSESLLYLINDLIDFSQIDSGRLLIASHPFNVRECLTASVEVWKTMAKKKGLTFNLQFDDRVPTMLIGDSVRIGQILSQLCNNAVKFTPQGSVTVSCKADSLSSIKQTCTLRIDVQDTGIGIALEDIPKLFTKPFYQLQDFERRSGGLGIGLMICSRLLSCMGGEIHARSPGKNQGSTFSVVLELPIGPGSQITASAMDTCSAEALTEEKSVKSFAVLVVDDNSVNQVIVSRFLKKLGIPNTTITLADDGEQALNILSSSQQKFDLIVLDLMMPGIDGFEVFRRLVLMFPDPDTRPKVVAVTANANAKVKQKCLDIGMNDYMTKPLMFDKFKSRLDQLRIYNPNMLTS